MLATTRFIQKISGMGDELEALTSTTVVEVSSSFPSWQYAWKMLVALITSAPECLHSLETAVAMMLLNS